MNYSKHCADKRDEFLLKASEMIDRHRCDKAISLMEAALSVYGCDFKCIQLIFRNKKLACEYEPNNEEDFYKICF